MAPRKFDKLYISNNRLNFSQIKVEKHKDAKNQQR